MRWRIFLTCSLILLIGLAYSSCANAQKASLLPRIGTVTVKVAPGKPANTFVPDRALGSGVDGSEKGDISKIYTPPNLRAMHSAGYRPLTYRLRTELGVEAWHWNPLGTWSDPKLRQGYWTSSDRSVNPILVCNGYSLPRRGNTMDQAGNTGYSRLDDGDSTTFWKSNPYLDHHFTREDNARHPQWIVVDLGNRKPVNALRIFWGTPYATQYQVEYWDGDDFGYINDNVPGKWRIFPKGKVTIGAGGMVFLKLRTRTIKVRYVRILLIAASGTSLAGSSDLRDRLGYAVRELYLGKVDLKGVFRDAIRHGKSKETQTRLYTSSTDPWHRALDQNPNSEQPGFDLIYKSGLTNGLPMLTPVALLYDTPENAAAEIRFLRSRGYAMRQIEMGEEPDGQYVTPEDYAALYIQWADTLHQVDPTLQFGGPVFQTAIDGWRTWPDEHGSSSWMKRFLKTLRSRNSLADFNFFSFEWYPFDIACVPTAPQLASAPHLLGNTMRLLKMEGVPRDIPWIITEYGYSSFAGQAEVDLPGALLNAEIAAQFLTLGGQAAYLYGCEPNTLMKELPNCDSWGNLMLFLSNDDREIRCSLPSYYGARMLTQEWAQPRSGIHRLYPAACELRNAKGQPLVTAYAVLRPDGKWAVLLLNKDPRRAHAVRIRFRDTASGAVSGFRGRLTQVQYSPAQFVWKANGERGYPTRNKPPRRTTPQIRPDSRFLLPAYSMTVLRGDRAKQRHLNYLPHLDYCISR